MRRIRDRRVVTARDKVCKGYRSMTVRHLLPAAALAAALAVAGCATTGAVGRRQALPPRPAGDARHDRARAGEQRPVVRPRIPHLCRRRRERAARAGLHPRPGRQRPGLCRDADDHPERRGRAAAAVAGFDRHRRRRLHAAARGGGVGLGGGVAHPGRPRPPRRGRVRHGRPADQARRRPDADLGGQRRRRRSTRGRRRRRSPARCRRWRASCLPASPGRRA